MSQLGLGLERCVCLSGVLGQVNLEKSLQNLIWKLISQSSLTHIPLGKPQVPRVRCAWFENH